MDFGIEVRFNQEFKQNIHFVTLYGCFLLKLRYYATLFFADPRDKSLNKFAIVLGESANGRN